ncbi:MAG: FAD-dependent monooxygenase [Acetobacteraceae bacterium]
MDCDVLIVGAGPTVLVLALWLTKFGVGVRIIDRTAGPGTTSRALAVQARTLELYGQLGLAEAVLAGGHQVPAVNLWASGRKRARLRFGAIGRGLTPYPFMLIFPQDQHERLLIERLQALGVSVARATELVGLTDLGGHVTARIRRPDGGEESWNTRYIAGCDGARSLVRETIGAGFPGGTYRHLFYVADVDTAGPTADGELHVNLDLADFLAVFPLARQGRARLIGTVSDQRAERADALRFDDVGADAIAHLSVAVERVNWFSTYHVHHRVAGQFQKGRAFLLGDAAHIHSPVGGQGMNTGIGDAINLAWKLASVLSDRAPEALLASYTAERIPFARRLVRTTDRIFTFVTSQDHMAALMRSRVAPVVMPLIARVGIWRRFLFRTASQITLNYRDGPLSRGVAGKIRGGDRLPWVRAGGEDNFSEASAGRCRRLPFST